MQNTSSSILCSFKMKINFKYLSISFVIVGFLTLLTGIVLVIFSDSIVRYMVKQESQLREGSDIYEKWIDLPIPIYLKVYMWNVTNAGEFQNLNDWSTIPILKEVGPYVYRERRLKYDIKSNPSKDTISYRQNVTYTFVPELSVGSDTKDLVNTVNVPLFSVAAILSQMVEERSPMPARLLLKLLTMSAFSNERLVKLNVTPREVIFGWRLNLIYDIITGVGAKIGLKFPPELQHGQFGFYLDRNGQNADGLWEVYSGIRDSSKFATIRTIDGISSRDKWWVDNCAFINGSDGTQFPPFVQKDTTLFVHSPEICRSVWFKYQRDTEYKGVKGYKFTLPPELFQSPLEYPPNYCFCGKVKKPLNGSCDLSGGSRIWSCKEGAPIVISNPHFLGASNQLFENIVGMKPEEEKHETFIDVEPITGIPLRVVKRLQIGLEVQPLHTWNNLGTPWNTLKHNWFPAIWAEESAELDDLLIKEIMDKLITPMGVLEVVKYLLIGFGLITVIVGGILFYIMNK